MFAVLLPTETINRELDYQLFLAAHLASRGGKVFIGRRDAIFAASRYLRGGLLVGKAFEPFFPHVDLDWYEDVSDRGIVSVHLDEEGAIFPGREDDWRTALARRLDVTKLRAEDVVCVWGRFQEAFYRRQNGPQRIHVTGHPRFDLYRPSYRAYFEPLSRKLRERYGKFVLLNTNLSSANNGLGIQHTFTKRFLYDPDNPPARREALRFWAHTSRILVSFVELIHRLSDELSDQHVIVRPHPSENHDYYKVVTTGLPNVSVVHEGSVAPWLFAATALIQDGCTTGVEAWLGDVPIINYKSLADDRYDLLLPNHYGTRCTTADEVIEVLREIQAGRPPPKREVDATDRELMLNLQEESMPRVLEAIEAARRGVGGSSYQSGAHRLHARVAEGLDVLRDGARRFSPRRRQTSLYSHQKFYGFGKADVGGRLRRVEAVTGIRTRWRLLSDELATVEPA